MLQNIRRGIELDTRLDEDGGHSLFKCKLAKSCCRELMMEDVGCSLVQLQSSKPVISEILSMQEEKHIQIVTLLWVVWSARN